MKSLLDYKKTAEFLMMAESTLRSKVMKKEIPFYKIGKSVRFSPEDLEEWLSEQRGNARS